MSDRQARNVIAWFRELGLELWADRRERRTIYDPAGVEIPGGLLADADIVAEALYRLLEREPVGVGFFRGPTAWHGALVTGSSFYESVCGLTYTHHRQAIVLRIAAHERLCGHCVRAWCARQLRRALEEFPPGAAIPRRERRR